MNLSERYKELRQTIKNSSGDTISIKDFSEQIKLATSRISELENGKREMSLTELKAYHHFFNVSFEYLLGETDIKSVDDTLKNICNATGLNEDTVLSLMDSRKKTGFTNPDLVNFIHDRGLFSYFTTIINSIILYTDRLYNKKEELYSKMPDCNINEEFLALNAIDVNSSVYGLSKKILDIKDRIEYLTFKLQQTVISLVKIYEEEKERDFNGKHNTPKE